MQPVLEKTPLDRISVTTEFSKVDPNTLFDHWTKPDLLKQWWPPEAELEPRKNGSYHYSWPKQNWHLRGKFTEFDRGKSLSFSWKWDHETVDTTNVRIRFEPLAGGGTRLNLQHGNYSESADAKEIRDEHIEGWLYFLGKLQEQIGG